MQRPGPVLIVLDTNVVVSALLKRASKHGKVFDLVLAGEAQVALDARILEEYHAVLARPKFKISSSAAEMVLSYLKVTGLMVDAVWLALDIGQVADSGDLPFAEVAVAAQAAALVTGNKRHFGFLEGTRVAVLTPSEFLEWVA